MTDSTLQPETPRTLTARVSRRLLLGLIAGGVAIVTIVLIAVVTAFGSPRIALGPTEVADLVPGACLEESDSSLASYTVIDCGTDPAQQVVAELDLSRDTEQYSTLAALSAYADAICERFLEYNLFVEPSVDTTTHQFVAIAVPAPEAVAAGDSRALCAVRPLDGTLTGSVYRAMP